MGRSWVRLGSKKICCTLPTDTCLKARLVAPPGDDLLEQAAGEINQVLESVEAQNPDPTRELAILIEPSDTGEQQLVLDWITTDIEILTPFDVNQ
jgi:hypothetical protein